MDKKSDYRLHTVDGQNVLIVVDDKSNEDKRIIKLNDSAREIFGLYESGKNKNEIADLLLEKYGIDKNQALNDVENVISALDNSEKSVNIEDALKKYGFVVSTPTGNSMRPMLKGGRDKVIIKPVTEPLKKYDVILYKRKGSYVLHRIIKITKDGYLIRGDNCFFTEKDIKDKNIIGKMTEFYRKNKNYSENNICYKVYVFIRINTFYFRFLIEEIRCILSKLKQTVKNKDIIKK